MPLSSTFTVDGKTYAITRPMSVPDQMHVARKLGPFLPRIPRVMTALKALLSDEERAQAEADDEAAPPEPLEIGGADEPQDKEFEADDPKLNAVLNSVEPMLQMFAEMREEDVNSIMTKCFRCVDRVGPNGMQPVWNNRTGNFQHEADYDLGVAAFICVEVVKASIGPFLREKLSLLVAQRPPLSTAQ